MTNVMQEAPAIGWAKGWLAVNRPQLAAYVVDHSDIEPAHAEAMFTWKRLTERLAQGLGCTTAEAEQIQATSLDYLASGRQNPTPQEKRGCFFFSALEYAALCHVLEREPRPSEDGLE